jgi:hypothetical protein
MVTKGVELFEAAWMKILFNGAIEASDCDVKDTRSRPFSCKWVSNSARVGLLIMLDVVRADAQLASSGNSVLVYIVDFVRGRKQKPRPTTKELSFRSVEFCRCLRVAFLNDDPVR